MHKLKFFFRSLLNRLEVLFWEKPMSCFSIWYPEDVGLDKGVGLSGGDNLVPVSLMEKEVGLKWKSGAGKEIVVSKKGVYQVQDCRVWVTCTRSGPPRSLKNIGYRRPLVFSRNNHPIKFPCSPLFLSFGFLGNVSNWFVFCKEPRFIRERVAMLYSTDSFDNNYFHFWVDCICDIWYVKKNLPKSQWPEVYLINFTGLKWQKEVLEICGLSEDDIVSFNECDALKVKDIMVPVREKGCMELPPWLCQAMREVSGWKPPDHPCSTRRIYISRADASRRRVENEEELREKLESIGFEICLLSSFSVKEQQELFFSASVICTPHGAALTNIVWCRSGTVVIDLIPEKYLVPCFKQLADQACVIYHPMVTKEASKSDSGLEGDIVVSHRQFEEIDKICSKFERQENRAFGDRAMVGWENE